LVSVRGAYAGPLFREFKPFDKAGAYGIQEWIGHTMVTSIQGEYNAVVGLPTTTLYKALKQFEI
jgi:septum formation protein